MNLAAERSFPTPLTSLQRQLLSCHMVPPATATRQGAEHVDLRGSGQASDDPIADKGPVSSTPVKVAFFGLGAMGSRMSKGEYFLRLSAHVHSATQTSSRPDWIRRLGGSPFSI